MKKKKARIQELIVILNEASKKYYQEDTEIMSNYEYDALYDELAALEKETNFILSNSPTQSVGFELLSKLNKVTLSHPTLSLDKTKDLEKLATFLKDKNGILSWKLDGLTIVLKYQNGELAEGITRGNGKIGEDITHNVKVFKNVPLKIAYKGELIVRGEGIISSSDFEKINETIEGEKYKNPRNLTSGTVRQLNSEIVANRNVNFIAFTLVNDVDYDVKNLKSNQIKWLEELGFTVVEHKIVNKKNIAKTVKTFEKKIETNDLGSDGLVLTFDEIEYSKSLGTTTKTPRDSIAFKWKDEMRETKLRNQTFGSRLESIENRFDKSDCGF